jgi:hypothetical protein
LDDIFEFAHDFAQKKKEEKKFYCLQPIVVKSHTWKRDEKPITGWEVVDGQQRLTTIRILLEYFEKEYLTGKSYKDRYNKEVFRIDYQTRPETKKFLENISSGGGDKSYIDHHFMATTYEAIGEWFEKKKKKDEMFDDLCDTILRTLIYDKEHQKREGIVQVIWYVIDKNPIETFTRINMGKIPLTSSELIKALFLRERNFSGGGSELMELRQVQIASEWDRIENALQNDDFWWFLNKGENDIPARIEFIFDLMRETALQKDPSLKEKTGTDQYATFRYFSSILHGDHGDYETVKKTWDDVGDPDDYETVKKTWDDVGDPDDYETVKATWDKVKEYFHCFEDWFNNYTWYHYIGFLIWCGKSIAELYCECKKAATKENVNTILEHLIRKHFSGIDFDDLSYDKNKDIIRKLLLLYNIECITAQCKTGHLLYKFPFKSFKKEDTWDIEHIDSYTANELNDKHSQNTWLESSDHALSMLEREREALKVPNNGGFGDLRKRIEQYLDAKEKNTDDFNKLCEQIQKIFGENENDEELKNNIGNLTLLDSKTNRGYKNALFRSKREIIIQKDRDGKFIPIGTKNVFLKYFDAEGISPASWSKIDIENYRNDIAKKLEIFLPCQAVEEV